MIMNIMNHESLPSEENLTLTTKLANNILATRSKPKDVRCEIEIGENNHHRSSHFSVERWRMAIEGCPTT